MSFFERYTESRLFVWFERLYILLFTNIFWVLATILGLGVFSVMPATVALYLIVRHHRETIDFKLIQTFFIIFKREYIRAQKLFFWLMLIVLIIGSNAFFYGRNLDTLSTLHTVGFAITLLMCLSFLAVLVHIVPVYIYFPGMNAWRLIKTAFLMSFAYPFRTVLLMVVVVVFVILTPVIPTVVPFFFMSGIAWVTWILVRGRYVLVAKYGQPLDINMYIPS